MPLPYYTKGNLPIQPKMWPANNAVGVSHQQRLEPYGYHTKPYKISQPDRALVPTAKSVEFSPGSNDQARKRIGVACGRCRQRKIKCSGDPGDGTGCKACKVSGTDVTKCQFVPVKSEPLSFILPSNVYFHDTDAMSSQNYLGRDMGDYASFDSRDRHWQGPQTVLPSMQADHLAHSRSSGPNEYGTLNGFPTHALDPSLSTSMTPSYDSSPQALSCGSPLSPSFPQAQQNSIRLPSMNVNDVSSWDLYSLQSSLPPPNLHERRLPAIQTTLPSMPYARPDMHGPGPAGSFHEHRSQMPAGGHPHHHSSEAAMYGWPDNSSALPRTGIDSPCMGSHKGRITAYSTPPHGTPEPYPICKKASKSSRSSGHTAPERGHANNSSSGKKEVKREKGKHGRVKREPSS